MATTRPRAGGSVRKVTSKNDPCPHGKGAKCDCRWRVQYVDGSGRQRERKFDTKAQADAHLTEVNKAKITTGSVPGHLTGDSPTVEQLCDKWFAHRADFTPGTVRNYRSKCRCHIVPFFGATTMVSKITNDQVEQFRDHLYAEEISPGEVITIISSVLKGMLEYAHEKGWVGRNPCIGVRFKPVPENEVYLPTRQNVLDMAEKIDPFYRLTIFLQALLGLRAGEVMGGSWDCIRDGYFRAYRQLDTAGELIPLKGKKEGEYRDIPIPPQMAEEFERHGHLYGREGWFFRSPRRPGYPIGRTAHTTAFNTARLMLGFHDGSFVPQCLRHYFCTNMVRVTQNIALVAVWAGHASVQTTYDNYFHYVDEDIRIGAAASALFLRPDFIEAAEAGKPVNDLVISPLREPGKKPRRRHLAGVAAGPL
ncbi:hypothetical protein FDA94_28495 [Herbidospora galbida]|uniref:Tyr recombinase domain-containing protein n=1 Tax=Herbidospora galbida TaxID=2575442 RepID=A0A4U3M8E1_9ACTN|nr:site-specific integrase [Herbidospora galbida]TKK84572.1 hypothetical protein FDA94_28495 [Herbidospora galbida]